MKMMWKVLVLTVLFIPAAYAQSPPVAWSAPVLEAGAGYTYVSGDVPSQSRLGLKGFNLLGSADFSRRFGLNLDLGYARTSDALHSGYSADLFTYMGGPVVYPVRRRNIKIYARVLFGGARETGVNFTDNGQIVLGWVNRFAWAAGGGAQCRLTQSLSLRAGVDYLHTSFYSPNVVVQGQSNVRPTVGLVYTFGEGREK